MNALNHPAVRCAIAVLAGGAYGFSFAPRDWPWLTLLSISVFFWLLTHTHERRISDAKIGYAFGLGLFSIGAYWLYFSFHLFGDAIAPLAALGSAAFIMIMALYPMIFAWVCQRFAPSNLSRGLFIAGLWILIEALRGWFLSGFPWLSLGYAFIDTPLALVAPFAGSYALGLLAALLAASLALLPQWRQSLSALSLACVLFCAALVIPAADPPSPSSAPLRVAIIQPNIAQHMKFLEDQLEPSMDYLEAQTRKLQGQADLVVWPESAVPSFIELQYPRLLAFAQEMERSGMHIVSGIFTYEQKDQRVFNSVVNLNRPSQTYRKHHLVPFGEFIPFRSLLKPLEQYILIPMSDISSGPDNPEALSVGAHRVGVFICYEAAFSNRLASQNQQAEYWINVSNDAWFGASSAPWQHLQITRMRALETGRAVIRATNTGVSALIDPQGQVSDYLGHQQSGALLGSIQPQQGLSVYSASGYGDLPILLFAALMCALGVTGRLMRTRSATANN